MIEDTENEVKVVKLKQKKEKWQSHDPGDDRWSDAL